MKYPACTLAKIISAGRYCVVSTDKEHVAEVKILEENLMKEMHSMDGMQTSECNLNCQMFVAVEDFTGQLRRGIIEKKLEHNLYEVLLIDYGRIVEVNKSLMRVIKNKEYIDIEPLAFIVTLYGLIPTKITYEEGIRKPRALKNWVPESLMFVQNLVKDNQEVIVRSILIQKRTVYGDLFIKPPQSLKYVSLRKLLCRNDFCIFSESNFLRLENLNSVIENAEFKTKMKEIEKWQKESFGKHQNNSSSSLITSLSPASSKVSISWDSSENSQTSDNDYGESLVDHLGRLGIGRGRLMELAAEMNNKESSTVEEEQNNSTREDESSAKPLLGRGKLLSKYWQTSNWDTASFSQNLECDLKTFNSDGFSEVSEKTLEDDNNSLSKQIAKVEKGRLLKEASTLLMKDININLFINGGVRNGTFGKETLKRAQKLLKGEKICESSETVSSSRSSLSEEIFTFQNYTQAWKQPLSSMKTSGYWVPHLVFEDTMVEPVNCFRELPIQLDIIQNLEKGGAFRELSQIQRWAIPAIRKQHNTIVIGSTKTGKTLSFIIPLIDYIQDETYFEELPEGNGPFVVILASSSRVCESIYYMCHSLLGNFSTSKIKKSNVKVVLAHGNGAEEEVWVNLTNGCDILISTPHCLVRLLEYPVLTNFERLTCLIFDEIDVLSQQPFRKNVRIIFEKAKFSMKDRHHQCILTGERWTSNVESLVKTYIKSYALIIGSSAEAVIYKKCKPSIHLVDRKQKRETLLNLLHDKINKSKTLVVCENETEASHLNNFLIERDISSFLAHEKIMADGLKDIHALWNMSANSVLVITDGVLNELNIRTARTLIHFELPSKYKTNFYLRYTTLEGFTRDKDYFLKREGNFSLQSIILVDDENHRQLPHIIDFVTRLGGKIPSKILGKCEEIRRAIEIEKSEVPLCTNLLSFGRCRNFKNCPQRHALARALDSPKNLPTRGWVNFVVLKTHDASNFSVKLTKHVDLDGKSTEIEDRSSELLKKLKEYFKKENSPRMVGVAGFGDVCAVKGIFEEEEVYYRAKVIQILKTDKHGKALEVKVKLMDEGSVWKRQTTELFELPSDLADFPPTSTDVWVVGIQPMDFDVTWSAVAYNFVSNLMMQDLRDNQTWSGKIVVALNNTLFLEPIKRKEFLPLLKTEVFDLVLQSELINKQVAVANNEQLPALLKLCSQGDIEVPEKEQRKKEHLAIVQPQWAFFDSDFVRVTFLAAEKTSTIFLQPKKFEKLLQDLEEDCQKEAAERKTQMKKSKTETINIGMFCLALFENGKWNRGRVESENDTQFEVFFIDHGDFYMIAKPDVIPISQKLLLRLPCQAIECSLVGIHPEDGSQVEVLQAIYSFSEHGTKDLYACIVDKNLEPTVTNGRKYKINLLSTKGISLNKLLIDEGIVQMDESEKKYVEDIKIADSSEEEEEEKEEEEELLDKKELTNSNIKNLTDNIFENEEESQLFKEFLSKFLPSFTFKPITSNQEVIKKEEIVQITATPESKNTDGELKLKTRDNVLTPKVLWCQNQTEIKIKIELGNVQDYSLECTMHNISFRCFVNEKFYALDLKLFGAINPQLTKLDIKAFSVVVVLTKLAYPFWPRLHADDEKHRWINYDVESVVDTKGNFYIEIQSVEEAIKAGLIRKGIRSKNIDPYSDSDEEEEETSADDMEENLDFD